MYWIKKDHFIFQVFRMNDFKDWNFKYMYKYLCYKEKMIYEIELGWARGRWFLSGSTQPGPHYWRAVVAQGNIFLAQMARIWKSLPKIEAPSQIINHFLINEQSMFRIPIIVFFVSCYHYVYIMVAKMWPKCSPNVAWIWPKSGPK